MSMTGQGLARDYANDAEVVAEIRSVNNRHLKVQTRVTDELQGLVPAIEKRIRERIRRGSLQVNVSVSGLPPALISKIDEAALQDYANKLTVLAERLRVEPPRSIVELVQLPGVVVDSQQGPGVELPQPIQSAVMKALEAALDALLEMRRREGENIRLELVRQADRMRELVDKVEQRAPAVVEEYRERLVTKLRSVLDENAIEASESDVLRETLFFADRSDIREELVRLRSHLDQFASVLDEDVSQGRRLDFLVQEMFRETNTIGAKASDAQISGWVVEMKTVLEQMREQIQNVE